jgi:DNA-binding PadR family transcriptional regulator
MDFRGIISPPCENIVVAVRAIIRARFTPAVSFPMKLAQYVKFREEKFGGVVFETRAEKVYTLNPAGAAVVREIEAGVAEADIPDRLRERFRDRSGAIAREAAAFIAELRQKGLVED